ncbi:hypothetical protein [Candidatus Odyssella acanthamoebae]|uniref:Uncharacterized protein n=1 Tax=Candidatus Odyssella acanthamoebae TaxID=91604 RepID=A0A077B255_9PROT|nr:hypothetical protein [Candidatus Paracaedibacter acanthamoebae]AIK97040.1 hypothetical protein ID47_10320 [Candidatus Paracaedibacter acanthamoebae]
MRKFLYLSALLSCLSSAAEIQGHSKEQILIEMVHNSIHAALEQYHKDDWHEIRDLASRFWRDPSSPLEQEVNIRVNKFHNFLLRTFNYDKKASLTILKHYFDYQLDCLQLDYENAPKSRFQVWSNIPPQYHATLAFEIVASNMGIKIGTDYHGHYALASEQARIIDDQQQKLKDELSKAFLPPPPPPPSPSLSPLPKLKHTQKHTKDGMPLIKLNGPLGESKSVPKITKIGSSALSRDILTEIKKKPIKLKPAADRMLRDKPISEENDFTALLKRRLEKIRYSIQDREEETEEEKG